MSDNDQIEIIKANLIQALESGVIHDGWWRAVLNIIDKDNE